MAVDESEAMKRNGGILWRVLNWIAMNGIVESHAGEEGDRQPQQWNNNNPSPDRIEIFQVVTWGEEEEEETGTLHWSLVSFSVYSILFSHIMPSAASDQPIRVHPNDQSDLVYKRIFPFAHLNYTALLSNHISSLALSRLSSVSGCVFLTLAYSSNQRVVCGFTR